MRDQASSAEEILQLCRGLSFFMEIIGTERNKPSYIWKRRDF